MIYFQMTNKNRPGSHKITAMIILFLLFSIVSESQDISTVREIYDFDTGDIYHFEVSTDIDYTLSNIEILDKFYSDDDDTLDYIRKVYSKTGTDRQVNR